MPAPEDDDLDDRPRRRRRPRDDDDDDDRPRIDEEDEDGNPISKSNGLATASLVLGLLSICLCMNVFTGIPAIILGVLGLNKSKRIGGRGHGLAIAGIVLGALGCLAVPVMIGLLLPAVQKVRSAASRSMTSNNIKQINLALQSHNDLNDGVPTAVHDPKGADLPAGRGLSWRVGVLPFMEQNSLYKSFNLTQAWDSPVNRPFSDMVIQTYTDPDDVPNQPTTRFQAFVGPRTAFDPVKRWKIQQLPNGAGNTILFVDADKLVPWASPQDIPYVPNGPLPKLGHPSRTVFLAGLADGSVRSLQKTMDPKALHKLIMVDDGPAPADAGE